MNATTPTMTYTVSDGRNDEFHVFTDFTTFHEFFMEAVKRGDRLILTVSRKDIMGFYLEPYEGYKRD